MTDPEYRPIPEDRDDEFDAMVQYAFRPESGPPDDDGEGDGEAESDDDDDEPDLGSKRGLFVGDDLQSICQHYWFEGWVRGERVSMPGLSAVATPPEHRRKGLVTRMLEESLTEYRERGDDFSVLWPFSRPFYGKYGWATCTEYLGLTCPPEALDVADGVPEGEYHRLDAEDWRDLEPVYEAHAGRYSLSVDRTEEWWRHRVFEWWESKPYVSSWWCDGDLRAYFTYKISDDEDGDGKRLGIWHNAHTDHEARLAMLRFCARHDSQVDTVSLNAPADADLLNVIDDHDDLECELNAGPMIRLVDVPAGLETLPYPEDATGSVTLDVADPLTDWHDDPIRLSVDAGVPTVERAPGGSPDVELGVGTLSQLAVGYRDGTAARRTGDLTVRESGAVERLDRLFPEVPTLLREGF